MNLLSITLLVSIVLSGAYSGNLRGQESTPVDLATIRKTTAQKLVEPEYEHPPKYTMVVTGPEANNRIWMVLDGFTTIFADMNGDGTLDPETEKFTAFESFEYPEGKRLLAKHQFRFGKVDGHSLSVELFVHSETFESASKVEQRRHDQLFENGWVRGWLGRLEERVKYEGMTGFVFTPKAEDAQVSWLGGPLSIVATDRDLRPRKKLGVPQKSDNYTVTIGCVG